MCLYFSGICLEGWVRKGFSFRVFIHPVGLLGPLKWDNFTLFNLPMHKLVSTNFKIPPSPPLPSSCSCFLYTTIVATANSQYTKVRRHVCEMNAFDIRVTITMRHKRKEGEEKKIEISLRQILNIFKYTLRSSLKSPWKNLLYTQWFTS